MVMKKKLYIVKNSEQYELEAYPLTVEEPKSQTDIRPWYDRVEGLEKKVDVSGMLHKVSDLGDRDFMFEHTDGNYYIISHADNKNFAADVQLAVDGMGGTTRGKMARVNPSYFAGYARRNKIGGSVPVDGESVEAGDLDNNNNVTGLRQINTRERHYKLGSWVTGAPAVAATMVYTPTIMSKTGLATAVSTPVEVTTLLFAPVTAALLAFSMNYTANWIAYKLENKGAPLDKKAKDLIWKDSLMKSGQMCASFLMITGTREVLEHALGQSLKKAWGGIHKMGGEICPVEIRAAVMLSMSLTFGIAMGTVSLLLNMRDKSVETKDVFKRAGVALITGLFAGAVASIDFENSGFSFLATWAALSLVPTAKLATKDGRAEIKESAANMGTSTKAVFKYVGKCIPSCTAEDIADFGAGFDGMAKTYGGGFHG